LLSLNLSHSQYGKMNNLEWGSKLWVRQTEKLRYLQFTAKT
jgi:hypothetical protein